MDVLMSPNCPLSPACQAHAHPSPRFPRKLAPIVGVHEVPGTRAPLAPAFTRAGRERGLSRRAAKTIGSTGDLRAASAVHRRLHAMPSPTPAAAGSPAPRSPLLWDWRIHQAPRPPPIVIPSSPEEHPTENSNVRQHFAASPPLESPELPSVTTWIIDDEQPQAKELEQQATPEEREDQQEQDEQEAQESGVARYSTTEEKKARLEHLEIGQQERQGRLRSLMATVHELILETRRARLGHD
jgi:hypothetical protein